MEEGDLEDVVDAFGAASEIAVTAGCAGVELNAGQWSLLRQFCSGLTNQREDELGMDRSLYLRRVIRAVREAAGPQAVVGLRWSADELAPWAGLVPETAAADGGRDRRRRGRRLRDGRAGVCLRRRRRRSLTATRRRASTSTLCRRCGPALPPAVAVVAQGSIVEPEMAAEIIGTGKADLVEMTRALIADPHLVRKVAAGESRARHGPASCATRPARSATRATRSSPVSPIPAPATRQSTRRRPRRTGRAHRARQGRHRRCSSSAWWAGGPRVRPGRRCGGSRRHVVRARRRSFGGMVLRRLPGARPPAPGTLHRLARVRVPVGGSRPRRRATRCSWKSWTPTTAPSSAAPDRGPGAASYSPSGRSRQSSRRRTSSGRAPARRRRYRARQSSGTPSAAPVGVGAAELLAGSRRSRHPRHPGLRRRPAARPDGRSRPGQRPAAAGRGARSSVASVVRSVEQSAVMVEDRFSGEVRSIEAAVLVDAGHRLPEDTLHRALSGFRPAAHRRGRRRPTDDPRGRPRGAPRRHGGPRGVGGAPPPAVPAVTRGSRRQAALGRLALAPGRAGAGRLSRRRGSPCRPRASATRSCSRRSPSARSRWRTASSSRPTSRTTPSTASRASSTPPTTPPAQPAEPASSSQKSTPPIRPTGPTRSSSTATCPRSSRPTGG